MLEFANTADGSKTIYNTEVGETYHSRNGALQESKHVFVNSGLQYYIARKTELSGIERDSISILEVGFGTGLNFLLSADFCVAKEIELVYTGIEAYPLSADMIGQTGYDQYTPLQLWQQFTDNYGQALTSETKLNPHCRLKIANCKLLEFTSKEQYDIIYFDAFASARQPEMWDEATIKHTVQFLKPGGVFVTYAITGNLKRALKALGCTIEKVPGAAGKREMLRAVKAI